VAGRDNDPNNDEDIDKSDVIDLRDTPPSAVMDHDRDHGYDITES